MTQLCEWNAFKKKKKKKKKFFLNLVLVKIKTWIANNFHTIESSTYQYRRLVQTAMHMSKLSPWATEIAWGDDNHVMK